MNKQHLLFDLDGTLINTVPDITSAINRMTSKLGWPPYSEQQVAHVIGRGISQTIYQLLAQRFDPSTALKWQQEAVELTQQAYLTLPMQKTTIYPKVAETLHYLANSRIKMAVVTNKSQPAAQAVLSHLGILDYFDAVLGADQIGCYKPHPALLQAGLNKLNATQKTTYFIGDSKTDWQAARYLSLDLLMVTYGYANGLDVRQSLPATGYLDHFDDILNWLDY